MINLIDVADNILRISKKRGCAAQVNMIRSESRDISLRNGEIERLLTSVELSTGVRLFKGNKSIIMGFSGEDFKDMEARVDRALENIDYLSEDKYKRLLQSSELDDGPLENLELSDEEYENLDIERIKEALKRIEASALGFSDKIKPSDMADFSGSMTDVHQFSTYGLRKSFFKTYYGFSYTAVAEDKGLKERDSWSESKRHFSDLPDFDNIGRIGRIAAERAVKRLGGKKIKSGERQVIFSRRTADDLLDLLCDALDGEEIVHRNSFLVDKLGKKLFPDIITVIDDPLIKRYPGSYPFDGEGVNGMKKAVVEKGALKTYLHNSYSAGKLGMELTGNASRGVSSEPHITVGNLYLQGGRGTLEDLLHEMKEGLLVDELFVSGINSVTGDFSFGCTGFLVENGIAASPVKEITIAGNILELYRNVIAVADDNLWKSSITSPSILVSKLAVAGT